MKTANFITLRDGSQIDPLNRTHLLKLSNQVQSLFRLAAKCWERRNNSGNAETLERYEKRSEKAQTEAENLLEPFAIRCSYPGLFPMFSYQGREYLSLTDCLEAVRESIQG